MLNLLWEILTDEDGGTLSITRKTANTLATASGMNTNFDEIEAQCNGNLDADNLAADGVTASKLNVDVVRSGYGLLQHTDGSLYVDVYGVLVNAGTNGIEWGRAGDMLLSSSATTPDGFTDVSATYEGKFIRISATALATGGADTHSHSHTHAVGSYAGPSHTHSSPYSGWTFGGSGTDMSLLAMGKSGEDFARPTANNTTGSGGTGTITGTSASDATVADNVPVFVSLKMYQKS